MSSTVLAFAGIRVRGREGVEDTLTRWASYTQVRVFQLSERGSRAPLGVVQQLRLPSAYADIRIKVVSERRAEFTTRD